MKEVKVYPKFKCDFCNKRSIKSRMLKHEIICYYNPNRICRECDGSGKVIIETGIPELGNYPPTDCHSCEIVKEIKEKTKEKIYE